MIKIRNIDNITRSNVIRQAIFDLAIDNDHFPLHNLLECELRRGRGIDRLAKFGVRQFGLTYEQVVKALFEMFPEYFQ